MWFVDAFAGEGRDHTGRPGSPLIAAQIALDLLADRSGTSDHIPMRILAIEKDRRAFEVLESNLGDLVARDSRIAEARCGTLHEFLPKFADFVGTKPVLYFLDPCGVDGLNVDDLPHALQGPHNEIFALFSDVGAHRLHATLVTPERDVELEAEQIRLAPMLFPDMTETEAQARRLEVERSNQALRATRDASERILAQALSAEAIPEVTAADPDDRLRVLTRIFMQKLQHAGARHVLAFPVRNNHNARVYQLVYATKSKAGLRAMKEAMHAALRTSSLPDEARQAIELELSLHVESIVSDVVHHFTGQVVRWTGDKNRGDVVSVRRFLLEDTPVFPNQFKAVRAALVDAGYAIEKQPLVFQF